MFFGGSMGLHIGMLAQNLKLKKKKDGSIKKNAFVFKFFI